MPTPFAAYVLQPFTDERLTELSQTPGSTTDPEFHGLVFCVEPRKDGVAPAVWKIRFTVHGQPFLRNIGSWPDVTLKEARGRAELARTLLTELVAIDGPFARFTDGNRGPKIIRGLWLEFMADETVADQSEDEETHVKQLKDAYSRAQTYLFPFIGDLTPADVTAQDVADGLNFAYQRLSESTVTKIRQDVQRFFRWCRSHKLVDTQSLPSNNELIHPLLRRPSQRIPSEPHPALAEKDVSRFVALLTRTDLIWKPGVLALLFTLLTASRVGNVVGSTTRVKTQAMRWTDLTKNMKLWIIPAPKMKTGRRGGNHVVPLPDEARAILLMMQYWQEKTGKSEFVFTNTKGKKLRYSNLPPLLIQLCGLDKKGFYDQESKKRIHIHGFRSTFKTWGTNHGVDSILTEISLHHIIDKLRYDRAKAIQRRRRVMQAWAEFCFAKAPEDWAVKAVQQLGNVCSGIKKTSLPKKVRKPLLIGYERPLLIEYTRK